MTIKEARKQYEQIQQELKKLKKDSDKVGKEIVFCQGVSYALRRLVRV